MGTFFVILIIGFVIYMIGRAWYKSTKKKNIQQAIKKIELPIEIKVTTTSHSSGTSSLNIEKFDPIKQDLNGNWILNPGAPFELTLINVDKKVTQEIRELLDNEEISDYKKDDKLVALFAAHNLKIKEIEDYKDKYRAQYFSKIEELKNSSSEWSNSGEKDKEDLLIEYRKIAIKGIYERANCNLEVLFEFEPKDITLDDELINDYGFENIQTYFNYADNLDKIRVIPNDNYSRPNFEKLVDLGLAIRGHDLSKDEILSTLTLKELNTLANNPEKEYKRKNQAIEYILTLGDLEQKIGKQVSLRELFKLKPLPPKYDYLNLSEIASTWSYHSQEVRLLMDTFRNSFYSWRNLKDKEFVKEYKVEPRDKEDPCPCAKARSQKIYLKNNPPRIPCHIGCNCFLNKEYNFD